MNTSQEYEKLTQEIYQLLIKADGINTVEVKHNVVLKGKSTQHQIDVFWEYEIAGVNHKVAIECKNYSSKVSLGKVRDFYSVLSDIGNIAGIMVTKIGFQRGCKKFANYYGIKLMELRKPNEEDWEGRIKKIVITATLVTPQIIKRHIVFDKEWVEENLNVTEESDLGYSLSGMADQIWIVDAEGKKIKNFHNLDQELPTDDKTGNELRYEYEFENGFIELEKHGQVKIKSVVYIYRVNIGTTSEIIIDGEEITKAVLKDAIEGKVKFINKDAYIK